MLQPGLLRKKSTKTHEISHIRVEIPQAPIPMTSDDEDIPLSTICEMIGTLPDLVQAQIMKYQRIAEQNRPTRHAHAIGQITEELAYQLTGENRNSDYPRPERYGPDPDLAREYLAERALMSKK
uniref:Uncharacterized protein n=1 Tax=Magallana gigas TaxID=29159 RepID=K1QVZ6_MAGGI